MRLAIIGKGGVGKTTIAGTLARVLARRGHRVLALDLDPNPGMAWTLGIDPHDEALPDPIAEHEEGRPPNVWNLREGIDAREAFERYSIEGPDGVRYLTPGKILGPDFLDDTSVFGVRELVAELGDDWDIVCDIDAATAVSCGRHLGFAERVLLVASPQKASAITVDRLRDLMYGKRIDTLASMSGSDPDHPGLEPIARIPFDESVRDADRRGVALLDHYPDSAALAEVERLADRLVAEDSAGSTPRA